MAPRKAKRSVGETRVLIDTSRGRPITILSRVFCRLPAFPLVFSFSLFLHFPLSFLKRIWIFSHQSPLRPLRPLWQHGDDRFATKVSVWRTYARTRSSCARHAIGRRMSGISSASSGAPASLSSALPLLTLEGARGAVHPLAAWNTADGSHPTSTRPCRKWGRAA